MPTTGRADKEPDNMNKWSKGIAMGAAAAVIGFGGFTATTANAATDDEIATYLTDAVAIQLGLTSTDALHQLIVDAMANNLIDPALTGAAGASVDGLSTLTPEELAALLDANLTQQLSTIEQTLIDLGVYSDPDSSEAVEDDDDDAYEENDEAYEDDDEEAYVDDDDDAYEDDDDAYKDDDDSDDEDDSDDNDDESDDEDDSDDED
jgi:hypothetical protein